MATITRPAIIAPPFQLSPRRTSVTSWKPHPRLSALAFVPGRATSAGRRRPSVRARGSDEGAGSSSSGVTSVDGAEGPKTAADAVNLGLQLYQKGWVRDAMALFTLALQLQPTAEEAQAALYNKACCHAAREEGEEAKEALREALSRYDLPFSLILSDPDLAAFRAMPQFQALQEQARKGGDDVGGKFRQDLKLISEVQAPFRGVRRFLYVALGMGAGIGTLFSVPRLLAALLGGPDAPDLIPTATNLAINLGGGAAMLGLYVWEGRGEEQQLARVNRDETLSRLPLRLNSGRVVELVQLRGITRPVILSGRKEVVARAVAKAERYRKLLGERGVLLLPLLQAPDGRAPPDKRKGFAASARAASPADPLAAFEERARQAAERRVSEADLRFKADPVSTGEWLQWVREQQRAEGVREGEEAFVVLRLDGRVRKSGTGMPDWPDLVNELPPLDSFVSKLER